VEHVEVVRDNGVATVTFCRPPVNALTRQVLADLAEVFRGFRDDTTVSAAVFRTCADRAFIAGVDLKEVAEAPSEPSPGYLVDRGRTARDTFDAIYNCAVPVVAAVDGAVIGGGLCIVACCDIIVASDRTTFGLTEINMGLLGASSHLVRMVGTYRAREMFLTGRLPGRPRQRGRRGRDGVCAHARDEEPTRTAPGEGVDEPQRVPALRRGLPDRAGLHKSAHAARGLPRGSGRVLRQA
jgi:1,4-dihydroxy-2-naphthoyl-CoA synthase